MPASGTSRLRWMSFKRFKRRDVDDLRLIPEAIYSEPRRTRPSIAPRKAASVLPEPVGAAISTSRPALIAGQASPWAGVGAAKLWSNHARTEGWKKSSGMKQTS